MIDTMSFLGAFFCPCGQLKAPFRAAMGISLPVSVNRPGNALKMRSLPLLTVHITARFPFPVPAVSPAARYCLHSA